MEQEARRSQNKNEVPTSQIPLFIENLPKNDEPLTEKNKKELDLVLLNTLVMYKQQNSTIEGADFLKLYQKASSFGVPTGVLMQYLELHKVKITSNNKPAPTSKNITYF